MNIAWYRFRCTFARRWLGYLGVALLIALVGGVAMASVAGARRTASGFHRFLADSNRSDLAIDSGPYDPKVIEAVGGLPEVTGHQTYVAFYTARLDPDGAPILDAVTDQGEWVGSVDGLYFDQDAMAITHGRMADPTKVGEVVISESMAELTHYGVGQRLPVGVFSADDVESGNEAAAPKDSLTVEIVGIGVFTDEVVQDEVDRVPRVLATPAFTAKERQWATYAWTGLRLRRGAADVPRVKAEYAGLLDPGSPVFFRETAITAAQAQRAIRPQAVALGVFGLIALLATLVLAGQALGRQLAVERDDLPQLRAIGAGPGTTAAQGLVGAALVIAVGVALALVVAVLLSPLAPIGSIRRVEVDRGVSVDWAVLAAGAATLVVLLSLVAVTLAWRQAPHRSAHRGRPNARPSRVVQGASAAGLSVAAVLGIGRAVRPGTGRTAVSTRSVMVGAAVAIMAMTASLTFSASLDALISQPQLFGWNWDEMLLASSGYGNLPKAATAKVLDADSNVEAWSGIYFGSMELDGMNVAVIGGQPDAAVNPPMLRGHALNGPDEVVLGEQTLEQLGKKIGDTVSTTDDSGPARLRVVGTATLATLGVGHGSHTSMGTGALVDYQHIPGVHRNDAGMADPGPNAVIVRFKPGTDTSQAHRDLAKKVPPLAVSGNSVDPVGVQKPAEIVNYQDMGSAPAILAGGLLVAALLSLILALFASVRRQRRELAVLKALGLTRRQVGATLTWQAAVTVTIGALVGVPAGIIVGRALWVTFAHQLHAVVRPEIPVVAVALVTAGTVIVSVLVAAIPGRAAARVPISVLLRSE
ncbi:ABC transporter permease [Aquihabitans sp. McL0605]|uniref:ABC transporter permease n=1 Tax=Aquihabitans sp. McL0605 TaxID=3415671 RepID=UPI003CF886EA